MHRPNAKCRDPFLITRLLQAILIWTVVLSCSVFSTQKTTEETPKDFSLIVPVELVVVPVTVEDGNGLPLAGLQKGDFELLDAGVRQKISFFSVDPVPLSVAILIDRSSDARTLSLLQQTLVPLTEAFSAFDEMAVYQFENTLDKVQDFTANKEEVLKAFKRISLKGSSPAFTSEPFSNETMINGIPLETGQGRVPPPKTINTHIDDAIFNSSIDVARRGRERRKVILIISNGQNAPGNRHSYDNTLESLTRAEIVVYGIGQGTAFLVRKNVLTRYASASGGSVLYPDKVSGFSETYQKISQLARNQYVIGFIPEAKMETTAYRRIEVSVTSKEAKIGKVRHRKGYFAVPHL